MQQKFLIIIFLLGCNIILKAQPKELCQDIKNAKAVKYYKEGADKKKYKGKREKRIEFLKKAMELEPYFVAANYLFGAELAKAIRVRGGSYAPCAKYFKIVIDSCPNYHSDPYFFMGEIEFDKENYKKSMEYLKKFMDFKSDDDEAFSRKYEEQYQLAKEDYKWAKFHAKHKDKKVPFDPKVVLNVSTEADEYLPLISPDNKKIYYTQRLKIKQNIQRTVYEKDNVVATELFIYSDVLRGNNTTSEGKLMPFPFNRDPQANYGGATVSIDNKHLIFTICKEGKMGYTNCDLYQTDYIYGMNEETGSKEWHWTIFKNLGPNINTSDGWESQPSLSADAKTLYFASSRADSKQIDIYTSQRNPDGSWGMCKSLGEPINTDYNDKSPFIHSDSQTLYFASDGHMGFGNYDVYYARADDNGVWQEPENIGSPINNEGAQHGFVVSTDGETVFFGSNEFKDKGGKGGYDVLSFELYKEARPEKVVFLTGEIKDEHGQLIKDASLELKNMTTKKITKFDIDTVDGTYAAVVSLRKGQDVVVSLKAKDKVFNSHYFAANDTSNTFTKLDVELEHIHPGKPFALNDIYFNHASAVLKKESKAMLDEFVIFLKEHLDLKIAIYGHTDDGGESESNLHLSTDRAFSVLEYLQENGIAHDRLSFKGFGETKPIATNATPEGRAKNRRTEFVITSE